MRPTLMITTLRRQYFAGEVVEGVASLNVQEVRQEFSKALQVLDP